MADILIRGMEMPEEGEKILIATDGSVWVNAWPTRGYMRMENVYAVPLPEGHGRLIDADAIEYTYTTARGNDDGHNWRVFAVGQDEVDDMPTIVPAEGGTDECSEN